MNILFYIIVIILMVAILLLFFYHDKSRENRLERLEKQKAKTLKAKQEKLTNHNK